MKEYNQEDYLMLSGIQHFAFCKRQWALIHIEHLWEENYHTIIGNIFHEKVHDANIVEKRKNIIISRAMPINSRILGINGECDVVEFHLDKNGVKIHGRERKYVLYPIEYKIGKPKTSDADVLQLVAQAMCLEEMFNCNINLGYLFYGKIRHRETIDITQELKDKVTKICCEMHELFNKGYTPKVKSFKNCNLCSLNDLCIPVLCNNRNVKNYIEKRINEEKENEEIM